MAVLVIAQHTHRALHAATRHAVAAALQLGSEVHMLVAGKDCDGAVRQAAAVAGVVKVLAADGDAYAWPLAENIAPLAASVGRRYGHIVMTATSTGKDIAPRIAALLDAPQISEITQVLSPERFVRPFYAGNVLETVECAEALKIVTVRQTAFPAAGDGGQAAVEALAAEQASALSAFVNVRESVSARPELASARVVVAGGRGLGSKENFARLESLADRLGAAIGASRAAVDAGFAPNDFQVGQTGKAVAPELYVAIGISGAIQHLAGMKDSKVIVAVNKDENAPIFEIADYGLVGDLFAILPELEAALERALA